MHKKNLMRTLTLSLAVMMATLTCGQTIMAEESKETTTETVEALAEPETKAPETQAPETQAPETQTPETQAPETQAPETQAPETQAPETQAPETQAPETQAPETQAPETQAPETQTPETQTAEETEKTTEAEKGEKDTKKETEKETSKEKESKEEKDTSEIKREGDASGIVGFSVNPGNYPAANISENARVIYNYLTQEMGLNHAAACGILANIQLESNFNPRALGDSGSSYGICQWHLGRFNALINHCNSNGLDYNTLEGQLSYLQSELNGGYGSIYSYIKNVPDTAQGSYDAAYYWCMHFEIPNDTANRSAQRGNLAMNEFYPQQFIADEMSQDLKERRDNLLSKITGNVSLKDKMPEQAVDIIENLDNEAGLAPMELGQEDEDEEMVSTDFEQTVEYDLAPMELEQTDEVFYESYLSFFNNKDLTAKYRQAIE